MLLSFFIMLVGDVALGQPLALQLAPVTAPFEAQLPPLTEPPLSRSAVPPDILFPPPVDPALAQPLVPIGTFNATPPTAAAATADIKVPNIRYKLDLKGLKEVGLEARFRSLSSLLEKGHQAGNAAQVAARSDEDVKLAGRLLRADGYFDAEASVVIGPLPDTVGTLHVVLTATPGPRYAIATVTVTGAAAEPERLARAALALVPGTPLLAPIIETAEANVALRLPEAGYPFVKIGARRILLDDATHTGTYDLPITPGRKARFGDIHTAGDAVFDSHHIEVLPRFKSGELYDSRRIDDLRQALIATGLLSSAAVEPVATGVIDADGIETTDLLVRETKGSWRSIAGSAGYGTGEGIKLTGAWTNRNLFPPEGAVSVAAVVGTQEQSLSTLFRRSNFRQRDRALQIGATASRQRFDAYNAQTIDFSASVSRVSTPIWQKRWTWSVGSEVIATRETRFNPARVVRDSSTYFIGALPLQLTYDRSNSLLDPTKGFRLTSRVSPEVQKRNNGGFGAYARVLFEGSVYYPVYNSVVLAGRARVGSAIGIGRDDLAPSRRLYAGGGGSVRGFGYQGLGPRDFDNKPLGGRALTEFAIEARYRFGDFGIVPFLDAGRVSESSAPSVSGLRYGAGIGGRYYTNFGPLRVDIATPLDRRAGEAVIAVYISIGQAF